MSCVICHEPITQTFWGPMGTGGVCRYDEDPNQEEQGLHVALVHAPIEVWATVPDNFTGRELITVACSCGNDSWDECEGRYAVVT